MFAPEPVFATTTPPVAHECLMDRRSPRPAGSTGGRDRHPGDGPAAREVVTSTKMGESWNPDSEMGVEST